MVFSAAAIDVAKHGFSRPEIYKDDLAGTVDAYDRDMFLCYKYHRTWPPRRTLELRVTVNDEGPIGKRIKDAMVSKGKPLILEKVKVWVQSMAKGGPVKEELDTKKPSPSPSAQPHKQNHTAVTAAAATAKEGSAVAVNKKEKKKENERKKGRKSIVMSERFNCRERDLYEILMDENSWKGFTQRISDIDVNYVLRNR